MAKEEGKEAKVIEHANIHAALSAFQGELEPFEKTATVEFEKKSGGKVKFSYTPLGEIMAKISPLLAKHGLNVRHEITKDGQRDAIEAVLTHSTYKVIENDSTDMEEKLAPQGGQGEIALKSRTTTIHKVTRVENELRSGPVRIYQGDDMKDIGAAITYARRYSLTMLLGISSEDDNDAALLQESAQNAIEFAFTKVKKGVTDAKSKEGMEKALKALQKDLDLLNKGKAPALGLRKEQYEELIKLGNERMVGLPEKEKKGEE